VWGIIVEEKLQQARSLIEAKRYDDARKLLKRLDHPTARKWLVKLDEIASEAPQRPNAGRWIFIGVIVIALLAVGVIVLQSTQRDSALRTRVFNMCFDMQRAAVTSGATAGEFNCSELVNSAFSTPVRRDILYNCNDAYPIFAHDFSNCVRTQDALWNLF
jgi:hypothetical protein